MAVLHRAYGFDAPRFLDEVRAEFGGSRMIDAGRLRERARVTAAAPTTVAASVLVDFRYDADWLDPPVGEDAEPARWLLILLANAVERDLPGLSNRFARSYHVLKCALPACGWSHDEVQRLLVGDSLSTLLAAESGIVIADMPHLRTLGGWLPRSESRALLGRLRAVEQAFRDPAPELTPTLDAYVKSVQKPAVDLLAMAHADATEMLTAAAGGDLDLMMFLD